MTLGYSVPTTQGSLGEELAGSGGGDGYERSPVFSAQHVTVGDGLYPYPGNNTTEPYAPFDQIDSETDKITFSAYFMEPGTSGVAADGGASASVALIIYRFCAPSGFVRVSRGYRFDWSSGSLTAGAAIGASVTATVSQVGSSAWWRATVTYDNASGSGGAGAAGVGDYVQARLFYNYIANTYANQPTFYDVADGGKGNNFFYFGDPTSLSTQNSSNEYYWTGGFVRKTAGAGVAEINHVLTVAPPFYPTDTTAGAGTPGKRGYVVLYNMIGSTAPNNNMVMSQNVTLPTGSGVSNWASGSDPICFTGFFRRYSSSEACDIVIRFGVGTAMSGGLHSGKGVDIQVTYNGSGSWSIASANKDTDVDVDSMTVNLSLIHI